MKDSSFKDYIMEQFNDIIGISGKSMFGAYAFFFNGKIFGMIADGKLYFKVGKHNSENFKYYDSKPFVYTSKKGKEVTMPYYEVPVDVIENTEELKEWVYNTVKDNK